LWWARCWGAVLFYVSLLLAATTVVAIGLGSGRVFATLSGFGVGLLTPVMYYEGRWVAFLTGWNGLEIRKFLSALGEMDTTPAEAQGLVIIFGGLFGIVSGLAGAALGWMASRNQRESLPAGSPSSGPTTR
jgi:hypothetical protein